MASKIVLLKWLSVLNVAHALLVIILGIASINVTDFYVGFFGMGIWLGGLVSVSKINRSRMQTRCNCCCYYTRTHSVKVSVRFELASKFLSSYHGNILYLNKSFDNGDLLSFCRKIVCLCSLFQRVGVSRVCLKIMNRELGKRDLELSRNFMLKE